MKDFCRSTCYVSIVLFIAMMYLTLKTGKDVDSDKFIKTLSQPLQEEYRLRVLERRSLYLRGYGLGLLLSGVYLVYSLYIKDDIVSKVQVVCTTGFITFLIAYLYYILSKKQPLMVTLLDTEEQKQEWYNIYKKMQFNYHIGMALGLGAIISFTHSVC
uniref:Uncharacterized protein n=1 Tax=viral metagenome TaxID=1070528 RepID=A0A6C0AC97_9ZZZZ